jgi:hypothetical protein
VSGFTTTLLTGLAADLATASIGTWNTSGVYTVTQTGIVLGTVPQGPDRIITLTAYGVSDSPNLSDSVIGVQVRCRWGGQDPRLVEDLSDLIYNRWHGMMGVTLTGGVRVVQCIRQSAVSLGQDSNMRWMNSSNYYLDVLRPSTNRT